MKQILPMLLCGVLVLFRGKDRSAAEPVSNAPAVTETSTNSQASVAAMRAEFAEISTKLQALQKQATNAPEVKAVITEYESARQALQSAQKNVMDLQQKLRNAVIAEVTKQDPSAKKLIERQQELMKEIHASTHPGINLPNRVFRDATMTNEPVKVPPVSPSTRGTGPNPAEPK